jgi:A/G-specific adenine glycosylase
VSAPRAATHLESIHERLLEWYRSNARDLPWRDRGCSAWGVFVSEIMAQQTPLSRVEPAWRRWISRWPEPSALAAEAPGEAVRAWDRLGYPRRALRLHDAATVMVERHGGRVPGSYAELLELPGVGPYTAAAVACFAFDLPEPVVDTNVRRVLTRTLLGAEHAAPALTRAEADLAGASMPVERTRANTWNVAVMELGALVCTARAPGCPTCPVADTCAWNVAGKPPHSGPPRRGQPWEGTDRQVRGRILAAARQAGEPVTRPELDGTADDPGQVDRCVHSLVIDGLLEPVGRDGFTLPR